MKPFPHRGAGAPARFITGEEQSEAQAVQPASVHSNGLNPGSSPGGATISPPRAFGTAFLLGRGVCDAEGQHRASVLDGHAEPKSGGRGGDPLPYNVHGAVTGRWKASLDHTVRKEERALDGKVFFDYADAEQRFLAVMAADPGVPCGRAGCPGRMKPWPDGLYKCNGCSRTKRVRMVIGHDAFGFCPDVS